MSDEHRQFRDRQDAGAVLASHLAQYSGREDVVVLALPRGGVPVAFEVAEALDVLLDIFLVRKLGLPEHPELAMGAIASGGARVLNEDVLSWYRVPRSAIDAVVRTEQAELERREREYRRGGSMTPLGGKVVILVDDGLATGATMKAAVQAVRQRDPSRVVVAVPVGARSTCDDLAGIADEIVCARTPEPFSAVGLWYAEFAQTSDGDVRELLERHDRRVAAETERR